MNHYLRFVRTFALSGVMVACSSGEGDSSTQAKIDSTHDRTPGTQTIAMPTADAGADAQAAADAAAFEDADAAPKSSGPLAPPEMPSA